MNQTEIYYADYHSQRIAAVIRDELQKDLKNGRGKVIRRGYSVLYGNSSRLGSVLVETMYLSNRYGEQFLKNKKNQDTIALSLYHSIEKIINLSK